MSYFHWIAGCSLGLAWIWRLARRGDWRAEDRRHLPSSSGTAGLPATHASALSFQPATKKRISKLRWFGLLHLDYENYEVIAVDDRSTDRTGEIMERIASARGARTSQGSANRRTASGVDGKAACHVERRQAGHGRLAAVYRR